MERKFNSEFRKKLVSKLEKVNIKQDMKTIYDIISSYDFSSNSNGMFFNINDFSDDCIQSLVDFTHEKGQEKECVKLEYTTYNHEEHETLNNKDKVIINKMKS